jgi:hypothetical protein
VTNGRSKAKGAAREGDDAEDERRFRAVGVSMLPAIFPRDTLVVRLATPKNLVPGAIVGYPASDGRVLAHRILEAGDRDLVIRGDFLDGLEDVPSGAVAYVVVRVEGRFGSFHVEGARGRLLTRMALSKRLRYRVARLSARSLMRGAIRLRRRLAGEAT